MFSIADSIFRSQSRKKGRQQHTKAPTESLKAPENKSGFFQSRKLRSKSRGRQQKRAGEKCTEGGCRRSRLSFSRNRRSRRGQSKEPSLISSTSVAHTLKGKLHPDQLSVNIASSSKETASQSNAEESDLPCSPSTMKTDALTPRSAGLESTGDFQLPSPDDVSQLEIDECGSTSTISDLSMDDPTKVRLYTKRGKVRPDVAASMKMSEKRAKDQTDWEIHFHPPKCISFEPLSESSTVHQLIDI